MKRYLFALVLLFVSCQKQDLQQHPKPKLRINIGSDPQTLDPRKARDLTSITLMHMFFEGLTRVSKTGEVELALAEGVEISDDGLEYRFTLRKSFWSNGEPVTSFDFANSWKAILDPQFPTDIASQLYVIKNARKVKLGEMNLEQVGIETPDAQTLVVELEQPVPYFLQLLSMASFYPVPKIANSDANWSINPETYVCNGPFALNSWKHSDEICALKNSCYWQSKDVKLGEIDLYMMSGDTEIQMFEEGKIDWAGSPLSTIPVDAVRALKKSEKLHINPFSATYFFRVNTAEKVFEKKNPLSSPLFRKALAFSLDRKGITDHILQGGQTPAKSLVPPEMGLSEKGYFHDGYQQKALSLLTDALLELDLTLETLEPIKVSYNNISERNAAIAQAIQKQWEEGLKIKVELEAVEPKIFFQRVSNKEYQLAAGSWTADFSDPINFLEVFKYKDTGTNNTNWESSKYIDLLNQSGLCMDSDERKKLMREAEQILMDQMPIIPIFHFALNYLQSEGLEEVALSPLGQIDFRWAHIEE